MYFVVNTRSGDRLGPYEEIRARQVLGSKNDPERQFTYTGPKRKSQDVWVLKTTDQMNHVPGMWMRLGDLVSLRSK